MINFLRKWGFEIIGGIFILFIVVYFLRTGGCNDQGYQTTDLQALNQRIDSLKKVIDTISPKIDIHYVETAGKALKAEVRYIKSEEKTKNEAYISMDTLGRVANFRKWVRDSTAYYQESSGAPE